MDISRKARGAPLEDPEGRTVMKRALLLPLFVLLWLCQGLFEILAYLLVGPADPEVVEE
jgi:hypothetical protein